MRMQVRRILRQVEPGLLDSIRWETVDYWLKQGKTPLEVVEIIRQ
jgi:hypothetical protein